MKTVLTPEERLERKRKIHKKFSLAHPEKVLEYRRKWQKANKEKVSIYRRNWKVNNESRFFRRIEDILAAAVVGSIFNSKSLGMTGINTHFTKRFFSEINKGNIVLNGWVVEKVVFGETATKPTTFIRKTA